MVSRKKYDCKSDSLYPTFIGYVFGVLCFSLLFFVNTSVVHAEGSVSYLTQPLVAASSVPFSPVADDLDVTMVPYEQWDLGGEVVLSAQGGVSPVSNACTGGRMTQGNYTCSTFSTSDNVSSFFSGYTFSKSCRIDVVLATYPKFFHGGDLNSDGRIDIYKGEWPSFADATGQLQPSTEFVGGMMLPGDEYKYSGAVNYPPETNPRYLSDGKERTEAEYVPEVLSAGDSVDQPPTNGGSQDSTLAFPNTECTNSPLNEIKSDCASGRKSYNEWAMWGNPVTMNTKVNLDTESVGDPAVAGTSTFCQTINGQSNCGNPFWYPDKGKVLARYTSDNSTCPLVNNVSGDLACINASAAVFGWVFKFSGFFQNLACIVRGDCLTNVNIMMNTESLTGSNQGCEEPCGDVYSDTLVASQRPPNYSKDCANFGVGQNSPCWPDTYIGTAGMCRVCGSMVPCTFVWKNWLKDNYDRQRTENKPCDETGWVTYKGKKYWMCNFEETNGVPGYFDFVKAFSANK